MKRMFVVAVALAVAAASCAGTRKGAMMSSTSGTAGEQDDSQSFTLRPLSVAGAPAIDGIKLVESGGQITLLYSTQDRSQPFRYELVIHAAPVDDIARASEVARIARMLPVTPRWDAQSIGNRYEVVYEVAGGAINDIHFQDAQGNTTRVSAEHSLEGFTRPHFVRQGTAVGASDVGAVANRKKVVVFPGGTKAAVKYVELAEGDDGVVGGAKDRWVAAKSVMSGATLFNVLPGRLTLSLSGAVGTGSRVVPDLLVYEFDADALANDIVVFATSKPALLILGRRPERPFRFTAENRSSLSQLSRPTVLVTSRFVHLAAVVSPRTDQAAILYGAVPIGALLQ
jgi:hypothetical protein